MLTNKVHFWNKSIPHLFDEFSSGYTGLSSKQSTISYQHYGNNLLETSDKRNSFMLFVLLFKNPLVILLLISAIFVAIMGEMKSAILISIITLSSTFIDFLQENKAHQAVELLKQKVRLKTWVFRDLQKQEINIERLVPGDVIEISAGDMIPADGCILEAKDFFIDQASLTGESFPVEKEPIQNPLNITNPAEVPNVVLMGSSVISGWARVLICRTGAQTSLGLLSKAFNNEDHANPFTISMQEFGLFLMRLTFVVVFVVIIINLYLGRSWLETLLFSIALGVGMTPEFLPMIISVSLAHGGKRLAKKNIITKRLSSIYGLGRMDVLCTDKTGTLTESHLQLDQAINPYGREDKQVFVWGYLNSYFESGFKSPIDAAILEYKHIDIENWEKIDEIPFDSAHKRISVLLDNKKERLFIIKGPLEDILKSCQYVKDENTQAIKELNLEMREKILSKFLSLSEQGFRVLGVGLKYMSQSQMCASIEDEKELIFAGLLSFMDHPRQDAGETIRLLSKDGIQVKIITGDNEHVTKYLCEKLNVFVKGLLLGEEIQLLNDQQLKISVEKNNLFCRVTPDQKSRIIRLLKSNGHIVGFIGDGINDVSALNTADVGISVKNAVDIAKEAADFIFLRCSLTVLHQGVLEGRRTFSNILKYIMMGTSSNLGNMISMVGASLFLPFLPMLPVQILLNNLLYDLSEIAIPFDYVEADELYAPSKWNLSFIKHFMLVFGPLSSVFDFCMFYVFIVLLSADESLFQTGWFVGSLATQILVIFLIRTKKNPFKGKPHFYLVLSSLGALTVGIFLPWSPFSSLFKFQALPLSFLITLFALICSYLFLVEMVKQVFYKKMTMVTYK